MKRNMRVDGDFVAEAPPTFAIDEAPPAQLPATVERRSPRRRMWARLFWTSLLLLLGGLVAYDFFAFVVDLATRSPALAAAFATLAVLTVVSAFAWSLAELKAWSRLARVDAARQRLTALEPGDAAATAALIEAVSDAVRHRSEGAALVARYQEAVAATHEAEQRLTLFKRFVLEPLDREAYGAIGRAARDVGLMTTIVPTAGLDTLIMLWRALRMLRRIAEIYGYRTGIGGTWALVRHLSRGAALVAATDIAADMLAQQLGGTLLDMAAAKIGGGAVAGNRTLRLGLLAMQLCRALPFEKEDLPTMRRMIRSWLAGKPPSAAQLPAGEAP